MTTTDSEPESDSRLPASSAYRLSDGTRVSVRPIRPSDKDALRGAFDRLGPRSRYQRFFTPTSRLTDEMLRYLTEVDAENHVALVAVKDSLDMKDDVGLAVARFIRLPGHPEVAEVAITVVDDMQGKGLGKLLLRALSREARARGIRTFRGEVLASNAAMQGLLRSAGAHVVAVDGEVLSFDVPVGEDEADDAQPLRRILRTVAAWITEITSSGGDLGEIDEERS